MTTQPYSAKIMAEIGLSHEGSVGIAQKFIENAKLSGANFVKFQMHLPEYESSSQEPFRVGFSIQDKSRWDYWQRTSFSQEGWRFLIKFCRDTEIEFCSSIFSTPALNFMLNEGVKYIKLGSGDLCNLELAEKLVGWDGQLILSTGMATYKEILDSVERFQVFLKSDRLTLLQCTSSYPTPLDKVGLNNMHKFASDFGCKVGLSDHSEGINAALVAIVQGASLIEKHVTFSRRLFGPDIKASITFEELSTLTKFRDDYDLIKTPVDKDILSDELTYERKIFGRSLGLNRTLEAGELVGWEDFCLRKPAGGLLWTDRAHLVGKRAKRTIHPIQLINHDDFE